MAELKEMAIIPEFASWESTLRCNMQCKHCGVSAGPHQKNFRGKELNTAEAKKMMADLKNLGVSKLIISGGEFTTRKDWQELLAFALKQFTMVRQISNGWLGERLLRMLEKIPGNERLIFSISLDGLMETHNRNRRNGSFEKVIEILGTETPVFRTVITTVMNKNFDELEEMFCLLLELRVPVWAIQLGLPEGYMPFSEFIGEERVFRLAHMIADWQNRAKRKMEIIPDNCFGYGHAMRKDFPWEGCPAGQKLITVLSNGDITGCPTTFHEICGNVREESLEKIWMGERMIKFRAKLPACDKCDGRVCKGGCRAVKKSIGKQLCF